MDIQESKTPHVMMRGTLVLRVVVQMCAVYFRAVQSGTINAMYCNAMQYNAM